MNHSLVFFISHVRVAAVMSLPWGLQTPPIAVTTPCRRRARDLDHKYEVDVRYTELELHT